MAFQVSPGVTFSEVDLSTTIPTASVSDAGFAGAFQKGPAMTIIKVSSEKELYDIFGGPTGVISSNWLTVASFLAYGGDIQIVRTVGDDSTNAQEPTPAADTGMLDADSSDSGWTDGESATVVGSITDSTNQTVGVRYSTLDDGAGNHSVTSVSVQTDNLAYSGEAVAEDDWYQVIPGTTAVLKFTTTLGDGGGTTVAIASDGLGSLSQTGTNIDVDVVGGLESGAAIDGTISSVDAVGGSLSSALITSLTGDAGNNRQLLITDTGGNHSIVTLTLVGSLTVQNQEQFESFSSNALASVRLVATTPGSWANKLKVNVITSSGSDYGDDLESGEAHIEIIQNSVVVESFAYVHLTDADSVDEQGNNNYYKNVLNNQSAFVYAGGDDLTNGDAEYELLGGSDDFDGAGTGRGAGYDLFNDSEQSDLSLIITGDDTQNMKTTEIAMDRRDCVAFVSPSNSSVNSNLPQATKAGKVKEDKATIGSNLNSYGFMDSGWKKMYDKYNDTWVQVPLNGDTAGLCVATDQSREPWYSPAGFNRGQIRNCAGLLFDPNKSSRDTLYKANVNPVASFPGEGFVLFGDKTLQKKSSAFDRLNVRRLFIVLEKAISGAAKYSLFEFNDEFTRGQFRSMVEPFLEDVKARRGIYDFLLVCDESNNTPEIIDKNEFVGDIFIKPARSINFIQLNFVAVKTGVSFQEIVGAV